ncbi:MAG: HlyD family efflux transporter periplasmic adaptor subunit [Cyanobacteriota/Melainabacteria group bacterium]
MENNLDNSKTEIKEENAPRTDLHCRYIKVVQRPEINGVFVGTYRSRALSMIRVPNGLLIVAVCCLVLVLLTVLCLVFVPWQQSIDGRGKVIIFSPMERPQHLEAPIPGRISKWFVRDGETVKQGDPIVELTEVDPKYLAENQLLRMRAHLSALQEKKAAARAKVSSYQAQIESLKLSRVSSVASIDKKKAQTRDRYSAAEQAVTAAQQNLKTSELNFERRKSLYQKGLRSKRDLELAEQELVKNKTELERALAQLEVARKEVEVADFELSKTDADTLAKVDSTAASLSSARETVATTEAEIQKLNIEIGNLESRIGQRILTAPCNGRVVRLLVAGAGETVKAGTQMAVIAPATNDLAAELIVKGNDAPLIAPGRPVRLQFAGWPAVQFTGWPSVAVGTFAGRVSVVDAVDDGTGKFRIIVVPDERAVELLEDQPWPSSQFLRPGSEVHGWVMLNTVPLGFELWRQFNAFPPSIDKSEMQSQSNFKLGDVKRKSK